MQSDKRSFFDVPGALGFGYTRYRHLEMATPHALIPNLLVDQSEVTESYL